MTALLRIIGFVWPGLALAGFAIAYGALWIWQLVTAAAASVPVSAPIGPIAAISIALPGLLLVGLAAWLDRRR
jgi:hypothetical protein